MRNLTDLSTYTALNPSELASTSLDCPICGREHNIPFQVVKAGNDLIGSIPDVIRSVSGRTPSQIGIVYDRHIEDKLEEMFFKSFKALSLPFSRLPLGEKGSLLEASVEIGNEGARDLPTDVDFLIGVGSGVISDLTKWITTKRSMPFLLIGTAASMNAYTSITGSMTENNVKTSKWLDPAAAVLLDSQLLASAPVEMTCAGIGDLLARNVANADWKLSEMIRGTYFCPVPYEMMSPYQDDFLPLASALGKNDSVAMRSLAEAILVSGYSMTVLDGETSPSSGSEHIISHFFDFQHEIFDLPKNLHGTQVGMGTMIMSTAMEMLRDIDPDDLDFDDIEHRSLSQSAINLDHKREFGEYGKVFDIIVASKRIHNRAFRGYLQQILGNWEEIWETVGQFMMPSREIQQVMKSAGAATKLSQINRTREDAIQALLYGAHYRPRYTVLDLFWEVGLFPGMETEILEKAGVLD